jgi:hypothetical protein
MDVEAHAIVIETWRAERLRGVLEGSRTRPLVVACVRHATAPGIGGEATVHPEEGVDRRTFVVKALGLPEVTPGSLFRELYGNLLARELGLSTPEPALVLLSPEFATAAAPVLKPRGLSVEAGHAAGTEYFHGGFSPPALEFPLEQAELAQAAQVYAFDLLIQNVDRRPEKPNCAYRGGQIIVYDFEMAFSFLLAIGGQDEPWAVAKHALGPAHLFYSVLRQSDADWTPFLARLERLSEERLDRLAASLPGDWKRDETRVRRHLLAVREHLGEFEAELRRSLG